VPAPVLNGDDGSSRWGFVAAIIISAIGHAAFFALVLIVLPGLLRSDTTSPPSYTVKIVDQVPAGDLGTHLPRLNSARRPEERQEAKRHQEPKPSTPAPTPPPPENDKNAIALNSLHSPPPTATPTPPPKPVSTPTPKARHTHERAKPTPKPTPKVAERHRKPKAAPTPAMAESKPTPSVEDKLKKVREQLLAEHLKKLKEQAEANSEKPKPAAASTGGGPVVASVDTAGKGMGVGPGTGSAGIQQDADFLLYYHSVQERIKNAWSFAGTNPNLTATVTFGINPDGSLNSVKVTDSSRDPAFDDSVVRAIRRASPFPAPPEKYRPQFAQGIEAVFKLGELNSSS
jgi:periplasmic protein TonB